MMLFASSLDSADDMEWSLSYIGGNSESFDFCCLHESIVVCFVNSDMVVVCCGCNESILVVSLVSNVASCFISVENFNGRNFSVRILKMTSIDTFWSGRNTENESQSIYGNRSNSSIKPTHVEPTPIQSKDLLQKLTVFDITTRFRLVLTTTFELQQVIMKIIRFLSLISAASAFSSFTGSSLPRYVHFFRFAG